MTDSTSRRLPWISSSRAAASPFRARRSSASVSSPLRRGRFLVLTQLISTFPCISPPPNSKAHTSPARRRRGYVRRISSRAVFPGSGGNIRRGRGGTGHTVMVQAIRTGPDKRHMHMVSFAGQREASRKRKEVSMVRTDFRRTTMPCLGTRFRKRAMPQIIPFALCAAYLPDSFGFVRCCLSRKSPFPGSSV